MRFKKSQEYKKTYTFSQAIAELKKHPEIRSVTKNSRWLIAKTKPITPKNCFKPELNKSPIGEFLIKIHLKDNSCILIERNTKKDKAKEKLKEHLTNILHPHISPDYIPCWGNIQEEVDTIAYHNDYYWLVIKSLDLLHDYEDKNWSLESLTKTLATAQILYRPTQIKRIKKFYKEKFDYKKKKYSLLLKYKDILETIGMWEEIEKRFSKYKREIGQKVIINTEVKDTFGVYINMEMKKHHGKKTTIIGTNDRYKHAYHVKTDKGRWTWGGDMLIPAEERK